MASDSAAAGDASTRDPASASIENPFDDAVAPSRSEATEHLTYEGTRVPKVLVILWLAFLIWGLVYLVRFVPDSIREWFLGK